MSESEDVLKAFKEGKSFFLSGPAGSGKSTLVKQFVSLCTLFNRELYVTSTTGKSAQQMNLGQDSSRTRVMTIHSWSGFNYYDELEPPEKTYDRVRKSRNAEKRFRDTDTLIIDEASMLDPNFLDALHYVSCRVRRNALPMGGIQLILIGDMFQLPCVRKSQKDHSVYCFQAKCWDKVVPTSFILKTIYRQTNSQLVDILNKVRVGEITSDVIEYLKSFPSQVDDENQYTFIYPRVAQVAKHNQERLLKLDGPEVVFKARMVEQSIFKTGNGNDSSRPVIGPAKFPSDTLIPEELVLKIGALVMLIVNINVDGGMVNGTQGLVIGYNQEQGTIKVVFAIKATAPLRFLESDWKDTSSYFIWDVPRKEFVISPWLKIIQFPIMLAFAITIHKAQGSTLARVCVDIGDSIFAPGQAYVALSRCITPDLLRIKSFVPESLHASEIVREFYQKIDKDKDQDTQDQVQISDIRNFFGRSENLNVVGPKPEISVYRSPATAEDGIFPEIMLSDCSNML
jgi:ATP-dependent DNA helicase PIF1